MLTGPKEPDSPQELVWHELRALADARRHGKEQEAEEALATLTIYMDPLGEITIPGDTPHDRRFDASRLAIIRLLAKNKLWLRTPKEIPEGEEWAQAYE